MTETQAPYEVPGRNAAYADAQQQVDRRAAWLADRAAPAGGHKTGMGGSDSWRMYYGSRYSLWAEKSGLIKPEEPDDLEKLLDDVDSFVNRSQDEQDGK